MRIKFFLGLLSSSPCSSPVLISLSLSLCGHHHPFFLSSSSSHHLSLAPTPATHSNPSLKAASFPPLVYLFISLLPLCPSWEKDLVQTLLERLLGQGARLPSPRTRTPRDQLNSIGRDSRRPRRTEPCSRPTMTTSWKSHLTFISSPPTSPILSCPSLAMSVTFTGSAGTKRPLPTSCHPM